MSAVATTSRPAVTAAVLSGGGWSPFVVSPNHPASVTSVDSTLRIGFGDFMDLAAPLIEIGAKADYSQVTLRASIDHGVSVRLTLISDPLLNRSEPLQIKHATLNFDVSLNRPRSLFFAESLYATAGLASKVNMILSEIGLDVGLQFEMPLSLISTMLQRRQIYFGLLVIERATGLTFEIPEFIPGDEIDSLSFSYHAIVAREFLWLCNDVKLFLPATKDILGWIQDLPTTQPGGSTYKVMFGPTPKTRNIFGQTVMLGEETVFLDDAVIENRDDVLRRLAVNDGQVMPVTFRPISRKGRYVFSNAPRLPDVPWDANLLGCIDLESKLDEALTTRYTDLAGASLAGLTSEEIEALTEQPRLDQDSHLIRD